MRRPLVQAEFDGITRDGKRIIIRVAIGDAHEVDTASGKDAGFFVEVEPLTKRFRQIGTDSLMAMCFSIECVRQTLRAFVAHGGGVFFRPGGSPIDLSSPSFMPIGLGLRKEFQMSNPVLPRKRKRSQ